MGQGNKVKTKKKLKKTEREHFNDLLLPVIAALCVMPFIIFMAERDTGLSKYLWFAQDGTITDLYAYYRSWFFIIVCICAVCILLLRLPLYKERTRSIKLFVPLFLYAILTVVATAASGAYSTVFVGNLYRYEGMLVLIGYAVIAFFAYQIMEKERDYKTIRNAILIMFGILTVIGVLQLTKHDLLNYEWMQSLVMTDEQFAVYGGQISDLFNGNNIYLTLFNPNYCGVFLTMFTAFFFVLAVTEKEKKWKIGYGIATIVSVIFVWFTYSRATLVALAVVFIVFLVLMGKERIRKWAKVVIPAIIAVAVVLVIADGVNHFKYLSRWVDTPEKSGVESIYTKDDGVWLTCDGETYVLSFMNETAADVSSGSESSDAGETAEWTTKDTLALKITDADGNSIDIQPDANGEYVLPFAKTEAKCTVMNIGDGDMINMLLDDYSLAFVQQDGTYYYSNESGNLDKMVEIDAVDMHGLEYLGSGRLYIWSRTIPLLKHYILTGAGPDRFAEVFPQNDYVGKMIYSNLTSRVMEGAHNMYLTTWVQTGLLSLIALLTFFVVLIRTCWRGYRKVKEQTLQTRMGLACFIGCLCYMVCGLFNDSTLYTTPVFFIFAGLALAGVIVPGKESETKMIFNKKRKKLE